MAEGVNFRDLLVAAFKGKVNVKELETRRQTLEAKKDDLQGELAKVQAELKEVDAAILEPIRNAVKAAATLGIEVPEEYSAHVKVNGNGSGHRTSGKFHWEVKGQVPFKADVSRAMWRLSHGSEGSAGRKGEGVLTAGEFWALVGSDPTRVKLGEKREVTLPNGKLVIYQKIEE